MDAIVLSHCTLEKSQLTWENPVTMNRWLGEYVSTLMSTILRHRPWKTCLNSLLSRKIYQQRHTAVDLQVKKPKRFVCYKMIMFCYDVLSSILSRRLCEMGHNTLLPSHLPKRPRYCRHQVRF